MLVLAILVLLIWIYLLVLHGRFWWIRPFHLPSARTSSPVSVAAIVPARNEADVIGSSVRSLLQQDYPGRLRVFLVDDNSTDLTADVAGAAAATLAMSDQLTVVRGSEPPPGWTGKLWAMQKGWHAVRAIRPDYVLLTDADISHVSDNVSRLISKAQNAECDLVSLMVMLRCETLAERFLIPAFVYFFFLLYPPAKISQPGSGVAGAAGGCMLLRFTTLEQIGGFESIRGEIIDDCALASRVKAAGRRLWLGVTCDTHSIRGYGTLGSIRDMIARTAFNQLRHSLWLLAFCVVGMLITFVAPFAIVWTKNPVSELLALAACILMFASYLPLLRLYRVNPFCAVSLPLAALFYLYATMVSAWNYWRGKGGQWKDRMQDQMTAN